MADLQTDEIEAGIKRLINFNSESGSLSVSVVADQKVVSDTKKKNKGRKSPKPLATECDKSKYVHEKGIAASHQEVIDTLLPNDDSEKKASHKRRSDGDIFTETPRNNSSKKSEYGPQKFASAEVMESRVILKAKRRHQESPEKLSSVSESRDSPQEICLNMEKNAEVSNGENAVRPKADIKEEIKNMKVAKKNLVSTSTKPHQIQESPEVSSTKEQNVSQTEAVRKFLEIPELKSKKKKKKKPKKKADNKSDQKEEVDGSDEIEAKESDNEEKKTVPKVCDVVGIEGKVPTQKILENLEKERIFPLKKKSLRFARAAYFCRLCDYHMDTVLDCDKHIRDSRHSRRKEIFHIEAKLSKLPPTTADQVRAVDGLLDRIYKEFALTDQEMEYRSELTKELQTFLNKSSELKNITLVLYGSSKSGFGLKDSDVNIDLLVQGEQNQARALTLAYKVMKESEHYTEVKSDFSAKLPCVYFRDIEQSLNCQLTISGALAPKTTNLLTIYSQLDPRVRKLGVVMRYFAKICKTDQQEEGTLPSYCYALMVVYYLQHCKPCVLPVLSKATEVPADQEEARSPTKKKKSPSPADFNIDNVQESMSWKSENTESVGSLWIGLLKFYSLDFDNSTSVISIRQKAVMSRAEKKWNTKRIAIEDPFSTKRNTARSVTSYEVFQYIWDCFRKAYFYFSLPTNYDQLTQKQKNLLHIQKSKAQKNNARPSNQNIKSSESINVEGTGSLKDCGKEELNIDAEDVDDSSDSVVILSEEEIDEEEDCKSATVNNDNKGDNYDRENVRKHSSQSVDSRQEDEAGHMCEQTNSSQATSNVVLNLQSNEKVNTKGVTETLEKLVLNSSCDKCQKEQDTSGQTVVRDASPSSGQNMARDLVNDVVLKGIAQLNVSEENDTGQGHHHGDIQEADNTGTKLEMADTIHHGDIQDVQSNSISEIEQGSDRTKSEIQGKGNSVSKCSEHLPKLQYDYIFAENRFTDGKGPLVVCSICDKEGHLKSSCPDETLPDLKPLPAMTKKSMQMLTETIKQVPRDFGLTNKEYKERESIRQELEDFIRELYPEEERKEEKRSVLQRSNKDHSMVGTKIPLGSRLVHNLHVHITDVAELHLFGSSDNGFGFKQSDLDLCVTFSDKETCEGLDLVGIIEEIAKKLKTHKGLYNVFPITTAKVPIVKFRHRYSQLEGDISLYNLLALHNTRMIMMYSRLDPRVRSLGYALKVFAKVCDIGDASRGSLSSYAYVLMLIYYLQQCRPPVLPVLQELYPGKEKPERIVDGWNAWYFDNESQLPKIFRTKNNQSVGELWMGLFTFYTEEFFLKDHVVCIRQREVLTRFEKLWNGKCIAIEDPFDLSHNLGGGLSRKMNQYIMKALIHGRLLYGTPIQGTPPENLSDYFFDKAHLTEGNPPNDRCCRVCSKIGHIARECPRLQLKKERDEKRKEDKRRKEKEEKKKYEEQRSQQKVLRRSGSDPQDREFQSYQRPNAMYNRSMSNPGQVHQRMPNSPTADRQNVSYNRPNQGHHQPVHQGSYVFNPQMYNCSPVPVHFQGNRPNSAPANMRPPGFVSNPQRPMSPGKAHFVNQQQRHPWVQQYLPSQRPSHPNMNIPMGTPRQQGPGMNPSNPAMPGYGNDMYPLPGTGQRMREPQQVYRPPHQRRK